MDARREQAGMTRTVGMLEPSNGPRGSLAQGGPPSLISNYISAGQSVAALSALTATRTTPGWNLPTFQPCNRRRSWHGTVTP